MNTRKDKIYRQYSANTEIIRVRSDKWYTFEDISIHKLYDLVCKNDIPRANKSYHEMFVNEGGVYRMFFDVDSKESININNVID